VTSSGRRRLRVAIGLIGLTGLAGLAVALLRPWVGGEAPGGTGRSSIRATLSVADALGAGDLVGYARATAPRPFVFPDDHGPHPEFRTEWWYYTGNLETAGGRHFGFQLTFFRTALSSAPPARGSAWGTAQVYLAHFALTDTRGGRFRAERRTSRAALGLAGARARPFGVWVEDWRVEGEGPSGLPMRLHAEEDDAALDLELGSAKPVVLQGERGLSRKGGEPGNASYYYSLTRMPARGTIRVGGETHAVTGLAWMDREWSTSALGPHLAGWDWFALQLAGDAELMVYRLRRKDGTADPWSAGTHVDARGATRALGPADVGLEALAGWTSPRSGVRYPSGWRLLVPALDLALELTPRLRDQELRVGPRYWEGAVAVRGTEHGRPVAGHGYVELVGYGE